MSSSEKLIDVATETVGKLATDIYSDLARPSVRRTGNALDTLFKIGLSPISLLDWGFEKTRVWLSEKIQDRLQATPPEYQQAPPSHLAIPLVLAISSAADNEDLRGLYAELLLKAMDSRTVNAVHPSYASVLAQMTPQEALVFISFKARQSHSLFIDMPRKYNSGVATIEELFHQRCIELGLIDPESGVWLQNMLRLRLLEMTVYTDAIYQEGEYDNPGPSVETRDERHLTMTEYGSAFIEACSPPTSAT